MAGIGNTFKRAVNLYSTANAQLVQTTGQIGNNAREMIARTDALSDAYRKAVATSVGMGHTIEEASGSAAQLVKMYGTGSPDSPAFNDSITAISAFAKITGESMAEWTNVFTRRYMAQSKSKDRKSVV